MVYTGSLISVVLSVDMSASEEIKVKYCLLMSEHSGMTLVKMDECAKGFTDSLCKFKFHNFAKNFELKHLNK